LDVVFQRKEARQVASHRLAASRESSDECNCLLVVLATSASAEGHAAGRISGSDPGEDRE